MTTTNPAAPVRSRSCPLCSAPPCTAAPAGEKRGFDLLRCRGCSTLFTRQPAHQEYSEYYTATNLRVPMFLDRRLTQLVRSFGTHHRVGRLLDIGFGAGSILRAARREGWGTFGVEVSATAVQHARSSHLGDVVLGTLEEVGYPDGYFDVVTASEVLEHLPDPHATVREVARVLRPGGLFWATTPNGGGLAWMLLRSDWSVVAPPEHTQLFTTRGVRRMFAPYFQNLRVRTHGLNVVELVKLGRTEAGGSGGTTPNSSELNERMSASPLRRGVKRCVNFGLGVTGLGDTLKIWAQTPS